MSALPVRETEQMDTIDSVEDVKTVVVDTLGLTGEAAMLSEDTALLGGIPEFDSLAVVELVAAVESRFGIEMDDDDISAEVFATIGSLARLVDEKRQQ